MSRVVLFAVVLAVLLVLSAAQTSSSSYSSSSAGTASTSVYSSSSSSSAASTGMTSASSSSTGTPAALTFCQTYSGTTTNATLQINLITTVVSRAAGGGIYTTNGVTYSIPGLFNASGPLYALFSGQIQYRVGAPNYITNSAAGAVLGAKLVAYFGALFGCTATGYPAITSTYNMYAVHANMSITNAQETYFNTQLATTLLSLGVPSSVVTSVAAPALGLFNRCGGPIAALNTTAPVQVCGAQDCPLATGATYGTCVQYYGYPGSSSSSSTGDGSNDATGRYALSVVSVFVAAIVASLVL